MELQYQIKENIIIIYIQNLMDIFVTPIIEKDITALISSQAPMHVVLNLEKVEILSSAGLGIFISIAGYLKKRDRKLVFSNLNRVVSRVFEVVKFNDMFHVFETEDEAVEFLKKL